MKPIQIGLLVVIGAIGGALVMKVMKRPAAVQMAAQNQTPELPAVIPPPPPAEAPPPVAEVQPAPTASVKPSPIQPPARREAPKPRRVNRPRPPAVTARVEPVKNDRVPPPAPQPEPVKEAAVTPFPAPPARTEPEPLPPAPREPEPRTVSLRAGMLLPVRLVDGLSTERNFPGDTFTGTLDRELVIDGFVIAERGARVQGRVVASYRGGKVKGVAAIAVEATRLRTADGQTIAIQTDSFERQAEETHKEDAVKVGGGAALGAIIGAIAGGGKGAAIGAAAGGAAGAGAVAMTRGKEARLPSEIRINFRLRAPVTITERR